MIEKQGYQSVFQDMKGQPVRSYDGPNTLTCAARSLGRLYVDSGRLCVILKSKFHKTRFRLFRASL